MKKKLLFSLILSCFPLLANAEYMGIDQVPVDSSDANKVFLIAVDNKDYKAISSWGDKITQNYDQTGFCAFANMGKPSVQVSKDILNQDSNNTNFSYFMSKKYYTIIPTNCDSISVWNVYSLLENEQYSYDIFKSVNALSQLEKDHIPTADNYEKQRNIIIEFLNKIPNDKYELFLPLIIKNNADFKIRNLAFDKYIEGRKEFSNKKTDPNDLLFQLKEKMKNNKNYVGTFNDNMYMSLFQPDLFLLTEMNKKVLDTLYIYWDYYKNSNGVLPPFGKEVIAKGGYTDEELQKMHLNNLSEMDLYRLYNTNQVLRLFHRVFQNYINDKNDLNIQKDDGNTMLSVMMNNSDYHLNYNPFAGSFVRFYLENGLNPLLKNKDGDTAFSSFMKNHGDDNSTNEIKKAFVERTYDFDPNNSK